MPDNLRDNLKGCIDDVLSVRGDIGAQLADVYLITRTWSGSEIGDGSYTDTEEKLDPVPAIVDLGHDVRLQQGGTIRQGDLILKEISMNQYSLDDLDPTTGQENIERFFRIDGLFYTVIHVRPRFVTWDVHIRKLTPYGGGF